MGKGNEESWRRKVWKMYHNTKRKNDGSKHENERNNINKDNNSFELTGFNWLFSLCVCVCADGKLKTWVYGVAAGATVLLVFIISMTYLAW